MNEETLAKPQQRKLLLSVGLSWMFDAMDIGILSFIAAALAAEWSLTPQQTGFFTSMNSVGMAVGAALAGYLADKYGRKSVLLWTLLVFSLASGISAAATSFTVLCILRFIAGVGLGGELPVAATLVSESVPAKERGRAVVLLESFWAAGWIASACIAYFIIPIYGWQAAFLICAIPALYVLYLRKTLPEPSRFIKQRQQPKLSFRLRFLSIWSEPHRRSTLMLWVLWFTVVFSYYGMFLWLPSIMVMKGFNLIKSFKYVLIMSLAQLPGYFTAAYCIEKFGRKFVLIIYLLLTAISAAWFGSTTTESMLIGAGICLSFFHLGAWGGLYAYTPELYPTNVRSTGVGLATSFGRIGGIIAPALVGILVAHKTAISTIFWLFFATILVGIVAVLWLGAETKGKELAER